MMMIIIWIVALIVTQDTEATCQPGCNPDPCPTGYVYDPCFDSCYSFSTSPKAYLKALQACTQNGAHFFVPNTVEEMLSVTARAASTATYWFGLQDWVRRGGGGGANQYWKFDNIYPSDPDGVWNWLDGTLYSPSKGTVVASNGGDIIDPLVNYVHWQTAPTAGTHFITSLGYNSTLQLWQVVPGSDFSVTKNYICEYSRACLKCPSGWSKFVDKCFYFASNTVSRTTAHTNCADSGAALWTPKVEYLAAYARAMGNSLNTQIWLGIYLRSSDNTWRWTDNDAEIQISDAMDFYTDEPGSGETEARLAEQGMDVSQARNVDDQFSGKGWKAIGPGSSFLFVCQKNAVPWYNGTTTRSPSLSIRQLLINKSVPIVENT